MPSLARDVAQFSWSMYAAVALSHLLWVVITMASAILHVGTLKMLELRAKVRCSISVSAWFVLQQMSACILKRSLWLYSIILLVAVDPPVELMANCTLGDVRLVNGTSELEGRVEACFGNLWGTICHNSWDNRDAGVICKQLFNPLFGKLIFRCMYINFKFHTSLTLNSRCHL